METKEQLLEINKKQKDFYNVRKRNFTTRLWSSLRGGLLKKIRKDIGVHDQAYAVHRAWFGDLSQKKVLDLGCYSGNFLSLHLAQHAKEYIGIDLSDVAIAKLKEKIKDIPTAQALAVDFFSDEFDHSDFDLIYAYGVLHHFKDTDMLIRHLKSMMKPDGEIISYDPLQTSLPVKFLRVIYRPFQSDAAWEWPFSRTTYRKYEKSFEIIERHGILGNSKMSFLLNFLPISEEKRVSLGQKMHKKDWEKSAVSDSHLFSCMHLTMLMKNKPV